MLVVITGATGFLGKKVCLELLKDPSNIIYALSRTEINFPNHERIKSIQFNLGDKIEGIIPNETIDVLYHLAWDGLSDVNSDIHLSQVQQHIDFIEQVLNHGCSRIVVSGTCFEYLNPIGPTSEAAPLGASTPYGLAKIQLHQEIVQLISEMNVETILIWMRLFYMYGLDQPVRTLVGSLVSSIRNNDEIFRIECGGNQLDYTEISLLASKICKLASAETESIAVNVASGYPTQIGELVRRISGELKSDILIDERTSIPNHVFWADISKYNQLI